MYQDLGDRREYKHIPEPKKSLHFFKELKTLVIIAMISTVLMLVFTNAQLFFGQILQKLSGDEIEIISRDSQTVLQDNSISDLVQYTSQELESIRGMIEDFKEEDTMTKDIAYSTESSLKSRVKEYPFEFNTLPPSNRLIIPSQNLDVPLITSAHKEMEDFNNGKFDEELSQGVVKYPTTSAPGEMGNTLIFGHTSTEARAKNPYGTIFKDIPTLQNGEVIQLVRKGQLYKYKIIDHRIVYPKDVNTTFLEYENQQKDFITLMGCYPIGKATKRYLVMAERVD